MHRTAPARLALPAILVTAVFALVGCSGGDSESTEAEEGPLQKYMSAMYDEEAYDQEYYDKRQEKTEAMIAECMAEEGFEYQPNTQSMTIVGDSSEEADGPEWGSTEFAEQYGYGIVSSPGMEEGTSESGEDEEPYVDPNEEYVQSLSESEQQAYWETLNGPQPTDEEIAAMDEGEYEYDWTEAGCYGAAEQAAQEDEGGVQAAYEDPEFAELFEQMNEIYAPLYTDENGTIANEELSALAQEWSSCMADSGYDYASPDSVTTALYDEWNEVQMPDGDDGEYQEPSDEQKQEFQKREIEIAQADAECKEKLDYEAEVQRVSFAVEQKFVDEHQDELDAMLAKYSIEKK